MRANACNRIECNEKKKPFFVVVLVMTAASVWHMEFEKLKKKEEESNTVCVLPKS